MSKKRRLPSKSTRDAIRRFQQARMDQTPSSIQLALLDEWNSLAFDYGVDVSIARQHVDVSQFGEFVAASGTAFATEIPVDVFIQSKTAMVFAHIFEFGIDGDTFVLLPNFNVDATASPSRMYILWRVMRKSDGKTLSARDLDAYRSSAVSA